MRRSLVLVPALVALTACTRAPETVVHLSAPTGGWVVRDAAGARLCALPCKLELDAEETVVIAPDEPPRPRGRGHEFVLHQVSLGRGAWSGSIRVREEPAPGALALRAFSSALAGAGARLLEARRDDRIASGLLLSGVGAAGLLASEAWPGRPREELWLERMSAR